MSERPEISIIVVSYNTREMTLECLHSVVAETRLTDYELLVVDNASSDGSAAAIAAEFPDLELIALEEKHPELKTSDSPTVRWPRGSTGCGPSRASSGSGSTSISMKKRRWPTSRRTWSRPSTRR